MKLSIFILISTLSIIVLGWVLSRKTVPNVTCDEDVIAILKSGDKLKAIKAYRQLHGASLQKAKEFLESHTP